MICWFWLVNILQLYLICVELDIKGFCGQKKYFCLNGQPICDHKHRFLDINIAHPASTSDYLSFGNYSICTLLERPGYLCDSLAIYGNNIYVNTPDIDPPLK